MTGKVIPSLLLALCATLAAPIAHAYAPGFYATDSKLSAGRWVRVHVDTTDIYEIDYSQLRAWGFSDPAKVNVYGCGAIRTTDQHFTADYPDDLRQTASLHTADGRLIFYGEGDVRATLGSDETAVFERNYYDTGAYYFLSDSEKAVPITENRYTEPSKSISDWHYSISLIEREVQNPGEGSVYFHGPVLKAGESESFQFGISEFASVTQPAGRFSYEAMVKTASIVRLPISASPNVFLVSNSAANSGITTSPVRLYVSANGSATFAPTTEAPLENASVSFSVTVPSTFTGTYAAIDKAYIVYPRRNSLAGKARLFMNFKRAVTGDGFSIDNAPAGTEVWNVTDPTAITRYATSPGSEGASVQCSFTLLSTRAPSRIVAFDPSRRQRSVSGYSIVSNQNLHSCAAPEMLVVASQATLDAANALADIHRKRGMDVLVVDQEQVFNEFASGSRHPGAVRRLAKMFYDREGEKLRYLTLYGSATWDPRSLLSDRSMCVVSFQAEAIEKARESASNYCADMYFGMLDDTYKHDNIGFTPTNIAIGRIPVLNNADGYRINAKIEHYLDNPPTAREYLQALAASDNGEEAEHLRQSREGVEIMSSNNAAITTTHAYILLYPNTNAKARECAALLKRSLSAGTGFFSFCGHSGMWSLTGEELYNISLANQYTYTNYPLAMFASCDAFPLDRHPNSLAETMLFKQDGGAIGIIAACRSVYLAHNRDIYLAVCEEYSRAAAGTTTGEVFARARNRMLATTNSSALCDNTLCYNLCGDPAMPVGAPDYTISLNSVNDISISGILKQPPVTLAGYHRKTQAHVTVPGLSKVTVSATIADSLGNVVSDFNGKALLEIYDAPATRNFVMEKDSSIVCDEILLATLPVDVTKGRINASVVMPDPLEHTPYNRIVITALDSLSRRTAAGVSTSVSIIGANGVPSADVDTSAPVIEQFYIDSPDFTNGDYTGANFTLTAIIDPSESGLARSTWGVSRSSTLTLDGKTGYPHAISSIAFDPDGKARLTLRIESLADGRHYFDLNLMNNAGESAGATLDFVVVGSTVNATLAADGDGPARKAAVFDLTGADKASRLIVADATGRTVFSKENCVFPYTWNLKNLAGQTVADGLYRAWALVENENSYGCTKPVEIVVLKQ